MRWTGQAAPEDLEELGWLPGTDCQGGAAALGRGMAPGSSEGTRNPPHLCLCSVHPPIRSGPDSAGHRAAKARQTWPCLGSLSQDGESDSCHESGDVHGGQGWPCKAPGRRWSQASEAAELAALYGESSLCKGPEVVCSSTQYISSFNKQALNGSHVSALCVGRQREQLWGLHRPFSQHRLDYAWGTNSPKPQGLQQQRFTFHSSYVFTAGGREKRDGGVTSWLLMILL